MFTTTVYFRTAPPININKEDRDTALSDFHFISASLEEPDKSIGIVGEHDRVAFRSSEVVQVRFSE